jgi:serine/threonine protein phosphatase PrpC/serine/threonine protein kinase
VTALVQKTKPSSSSSSQVVTQRQRVLVVGKRAWTAADIAARSTVPLSTDQVVDKAQRCQYYWSVELHCFTKLGNAAPGLPRFLGTVTDQDQRRWMLFDILQAPPSISTMAPLESLLAEGDDATPSPQYEIAPSLQNLMDLDRLTSTEASATSTARHHHLYSISKALLLGRGDDDDDDDYDQDTNLLASTLDVVLEQVLEILTHVHAHAIVHRDIKPSNVLVAVVDRSDSGKCDDDGNDDDDDVAKPRLVLIDFGSAGDLSTAGLLSKNIGLSSRRMAISPLYAAPEVHTEWDHSKHAVNFDCFSTAILYLQLLFQYLDERTESGFHQQLAQASWNLDVWLHSALQSKVRPAGLDSALHVLQERPGLWKLLQEMLRVSPDERLSSADALARFIKIKRHALTPGTRIVPAVPDPDFEDGPYLRNVLETLDVCEVPRSDSTTALVCPLHFVASFDRQSPMGLYLAEADADAWEWDNEETRSRWISAVTDARPGDVFVQGIVPGSQADRMGIFAVGDRLQGIGELPLGDGGFDRAVEMVRVALRLAALFVLLVSGWLAWVRLIALLIVFLFRRSKQIQQQPKSVNYVTLHFDRKSVFETKQKETSTDISSELNQASFVQKTDQGAWSFTGRREAQEDTYILHEISNAKGRSVLLAGVFDGHCGNAASSFLQSEFPPTFSRNLDRKVPIQSLLDRAWTECCEAYRESCVLTADECVSEYDEKEGILQAYTASKGFVGGSTASMFALDKQTGLLAALNCGDSRGLVIGANGQLIFQTIDHTPQQELERLTAAANQGLGYCIPQCVLGKWVLRVDIFEYGVARSLEGHFANSIGITSLADISVMQAEPGMILLLATDGFFEVIDSAEASQLVTKMKANNMSAGDAAKALCSLAYTRASNDNISVVVTFL